MPGLRQALAEPRDYGAGSDAPGGGDGQDTSVQALALRGARSHFLSRRAVWTQGQLAAPAVAVGDLAAGTGAEAAQSAPPQHTASHAGSQAQQEYADPCALVCAATRPRPRESGRDVRETSGAFIPRFSYQRSGHEQLVLLQVGQHVGVKPGFFFIPSGCAVRVDQEVRGQRCA